MFWELVELILEKEWRDRKLVLEVGGVGVRIRVFGRGCLVR